MILYINYNINSLCNKILKEQLDKLELKYSITSFSEVEIRETITDAKMKQLNAALNNYSIEIVENQKSIMIQKIKDAIIEMVFLEEKLPLKTSSYLSNKLCQSYGYLSNLFSNVTYSTIENFVLLQKTERAKQLLTTNEFTITEIGIKLYYSSTAHFCNQFKRVTGLTPTAFQRIINKRHKPDKVEQ